MALVIVLALALAAALALGPVPVQAATARTTTTVARPVAHLLREAQALQLPPSRRHHQNPNRTRLLPR